MKKKYKKLTFYLVVLVMGIGMVTFPIGEGDTQEKEGAEQVSAKVLPDALSSLMDTMGENTVPPAPTVTPAATATPTPLPTPTPVPTLTPEENQLLESVPEDIVEFVEKYFAVRLNGTAEEYRALFYHGGELDEQLANRRVEYIVAYHDLKCYAKRGTGEIDYVVYVQNDVEIATIDTYAPSIDQLFIKYDEDGEPKLYLYGNTFTQEETAYYEALRTSQDVAALIEDVNARLEQAITADEALRDFFARLSKEAGEEE